MEVFTKILAIWGVVSWPISFFALVFFFIRKVKNKSWSYKLSFLIWKTIITLSLFTLLCCATVFAVFLENPNPAGFIPFVLLLEFIPLFLTSVICFAFLKPTRVPEYAID